MLPSRRTKSALLGAALLLGLGSSAHADVKTDIATLQRAYRSLGADVEVRKPRLLERSQQIPLQFVGDLTRSALAGAVQRRCARVVVIAAPTSSFVLRALPTDLNRVAPPGYSSVAGAAELELCGDELTELGALVLEMRSPRGIVQVLQVDSQTPSPSLVSFLPHRLAGPSAAPTRSSSRPRQQPVEQRRAQVLARWRTDPASDIHEFLIDPNSAGDAVLEVGAGCHQIRALQSPQARNSTPSVDDLDVEVLDLTDGDLLARDVSENLDSLVNFCTAEAHKLRLRVLGRGPTTAVQLMVQHLPFPEGLPVGFGSMGRANLALGMRHARLGPLSGEPVSRFLGIQGRTLVPALIEPGNCYVALIAAAGGSVRILSLNVRVGPIQQTAQADSDLPAIAVAFCNSEHLAATLEISALGQNLVWVGGIWQTARLPLGEIIQ